MAFLKSALRGRQGEHEYYASALTWGELDQMAVLPEDLPELDEDRQMQRMLAKKRIAELSDYLTKTPSHFFSALTLIILPRDLGEMAAEGTDYAFAPNPEGSDGLGDAGVLELSGRVRLLPADGQHRLRGAMEAMKWRPSLAEETVPVVLLPYRETQQVRQLFADLNLNAKPVNKTVGYAFDGRDPSVLLSKHVMETIDLFRGRVNLRSNSLPKTSANVITLNVLVEGTRHISSALANEGESVALDGNWESLRHPLTVAWRSVIEPFEDIDGSGEGWKRVLDDESRASGHLRDVYLFPHGLGWKALAKAAGQLIKDRGKKKWAAVYRSAVDAIDWSRGNPAWEGVAVNQGRVNNTDVSVDATARIILDVATGKAEGRSGLLPLKQG